MREFGRHKKILRRRILSGEVCLRKKIGGETEEELLRTRLSKVQVVLHNQDNREHDILDSDDYYQFHGGATAAVRQFSGVQPTVYHGDHSRPFAPRIRKLEDLLELCEAGL